MGKEKPVTVGREIKEHVTHIGPHREGAGLKPAKTGLFLKRRCSKIKYLERSAKEILW